MFGAISQLVFVSPHRHLIYITDINEHSVTGQFEHLSCFFPALLALGNSTLSSLTPNEIELHQMAALGLAESCWLLYKDTKTGLGPEDVLFDPFKPGDMQSGRFIEHYDAWVAAGRRGAGPIGFNPPPKPMESRLYLAQHRDYSVQHREYNLRPEVSCWALSTLSGSLTFSRLSRQCMSCGRRQKIPSGVNETGK